MAEDNVVSVESDGEALSSSQVQEELECRHSEGELQAISQLRLLNARLAELKSEMELLEDERSEYLAVLHSISDESLRERALRFVES